MIKDTRFQTFELKIEIHPLQMMRQLPSKGPLHRREVHGCHFDQLSTITSFVKLTASEALEIVAVHLVGFSDNGVTGAAQAAESRRGCQQKYLSFLPAKLAQLAYLIIVKISLTLTPSIPCFSLFQLAKSSSHRVCCQ